MKSLDIKPMRKQKLSDAVADELERLIVTKTLKEGDTLPSERDLMSSFEVGRPSVREALTKLSQKGLVSIKSGEKTRVSRPKTETILSNVSGLAIGLLAQDEERSQFEHLRQVLEVSVVREAARVRTRQDLEKLEAILERNRLCCEDYDSFVDTDIEFHLTIISTLNNPMLTTLYNTLISWLMKTRNSVDYVPFHKRNYEEHVTIFEALKSGEADKAEQAMKNHLNTVMRIETS
ncbi:FCD domain-containing protein [Vibrio sp. CyArs1]|uniref:FCD domain-containing protein n=1 Tax=Vibrio sp. CyArs1 TaxID=2682577 RepID=UPI001F064F26|nr:FCD domain-containing protein [Vibrio sp. CyArs1]